MTCESGRERRLQELRKESLFPRSIQVQRDLGWISERAHYDSEGEVPYATLSYRTRGLRAREF